MSDEIGVILLMLGVILLAGLAVAIRFGQTRHEWHASPWQHGTMRRKVNGRWQYRAMTEDEEWEEFSRSAW